MEMSTMVEISGVPAEVRWTIAARSVIALT